MANKKIDANYITISLSTDIYPREAIYGAAYVFIDKMYIYLDTAGKNKMNVTLKAKRLLSSKKLMEMKGEFLNELLNYAHRINIAKYNKKIRENIVEFALYSAIEGDKSGELDEFDDPLGIAIPWEEKYGKKKK